MGILNILRRLKLSTTDAAIVAVVVVAGLNALVEFWSWLSALP